MFHVKPQAGEDYVVAFLSILAVLITVLALMLLSQG